MRPSINNPIVASHAAGEDVAAIVAGLDLDDGRASELLANAWHGIATEPLRATTPEVAQVLELLRSALQAADEQQGLNTGGLARCPFCLHRCLWGEAAYCTHFVGVFGAELAPEDLCSAELADRWREARSAAEGHELPVGILPDAVSKEWEESAIHSLLAMLKHCGAIAIETMASDGCRMEMVFAMSAGELQQELDRWLRQIEWWAETLADGESD